MSRLGSIRTCVRWALVAAPCALAHAQENVLLVIADDLGVDRVAAYGAHPDPGRTPHIDALAAAGVLFRNAWAYPVCSPTRATMLTGLYGFRTGIGGIVRDYSLSDPGLSLAEETLPEVIAPEYSSVVLGKWHLGNDWSHGPAHAVDSGFAHHAGSRFNLRSGSGGSNLAPDVYFDWVKAVDGLEGPETAYATTDTVDDALRAMKILPEPWFVWLAFNAPHKPFHKPPAHLHSFALAGDPEDSPVAHMKAMTEAMDTEIGRLMESVDLDRTTVIFIGDNGTAVDATSAPFDPAHAKGTLYQGGVHVPLIVVGPRVAEPGSECAALVSATDVFATVTDIAGRGERSRDGVSFLSYLADPDAPSIRRYLYAEAFTPNGPFPYKRLRRAARNERYKLIERRTEGERELYDLSRDPLERVDLLRQPLGPEAAAALLELQEFLDRLASSH